MTSFPIEKPKLEDKLLKGEELLKDKKLKEIVEDRILENEDKLVVDEKTYIQKDPWNSALIHLYLNNQIKTEVSEEHIEEFFQHYDKKGHTIKHTLYRKIIPIQKSGFKWEEPPSRMLRRRFRKKADELISLVSQLNGLTVKNFSLDAQYIYSSDMISDDFGDVAGFSSKKAKKRREEKSGVSLLFNRTFIKNKQENIIFLNSSLGDNHKEEWKSSSYMLSKIIELAQHYRGRGDFKSIIREFVMAMNYEIALNYSQKSSLFLGIRREGALEYVNWGGINLYLYDGEKFEVVDEGNENYVGGFVQLIKSKHGNKVIDLLYPDMIKINRIDLKGYIGVLIATKNLDSAIRGKRRIRFNDGKELIEKLNKKAEKLKRYGDAGALFFYL